MSKKRILLRITLTTLCLTLLLYIIFLYTIDSSLDKEYAFLTVNDPITTKHYPIEQCDEIWFFYGSIDGKPRKTVFVNATPNISLVNDNSYFVELSTNGSLQEIISLTIEESILHVTIQEEYYNLVHADDPSYAYDKGLYLDCSAFDITIHAPISHFYSGTQTTLAWDTPKTTDMRITFQEETHAIITNINTETFFLNSCESSMVTLSGNVSNEAVINAFHNSQIDAVNLIAKAKKDHTSNRPFGNSCIQYTDTTINSFDTGSVITILIILSSAICITVDIYYIYKIIRHK